MDKWSPRYLFGESNGALFLPKVRIWVLKFFNSVKLQNHSLINNLGHRWFLGLAFVELQNITEKGHVKAIRLS